MLPLYHGILGAAISIILLLAFPQIGWLGASIIFLSSILLDFDHYLYYAIKKRDLSLKRAYAYFIRLRRYGIDNEDYAYKRPILIFHGIEFCIILLLLSIFSKFFLWVFIGFMIHMLLDYLEMIASKQPMYFKFSQIYVLARNKSKNKGI
jgi:hypothetical protein